MTYEDQVRRQMEEAAKAQANGSADSECPVEGDVEAAFSVRGSFAKARRTVNKLKLREMRGVSHIPYGKSKRGQNRKGKNG